MMRDHFVYRAIDSSGRLLYVGCTGKPWKRWLEHRSGSLWADYVARFRVAGPYEKATARRIERAAIHTEDPIFNGESLVNRAETRQRRKDMDRLLSGLPDKPSKDAPMSEWIALRDLIEEAASEYDEANPTRVALYVKQAA